MRMCIDACFPIFLGPTPARKSPPNSRSRSAASAFVWAPSRESYLHVGVHEQWCAYMYGMHVYVLYCDSPWLACKHACVHACIRFVLHGRAPVRDAKAEGERQGESKGAPLPTHPSGCAAGADPQRPNLSPGRLARVLLRARPLLGFGRIALHLQDRGPEAHQYRVGVGERHTNQQHNSERVAMDIGPSWRTACLRHYGLSLPEAAERDASRPKGAILCWGSSGRVTHHSNPADGLALVRRS